VVLLEVDHQREGKQYICCYSCSVQGSKTELSSFGGTISSYSNVMKEQLYDLNQFQSGFSIVVARFGKRK